MAQPIDPQILMRELSIADLCGTAERYYAELSDPTHVLSKPFGDVPEAPMLLCRIPPLLSGLRLGQSMVVLDFGAGTCWLSRLLNQMRCVTISVDPSRTALELGKRLFQISPIVGDYVAPPRFIPFDGEQIEVADEAVDRVVCFDTFHHVPNQRQVLSEFHRVLKPGGIVGFSEPGRVHSQSPEAQSEMRQHQVLENDIRLEDIRALAFDIGFTDLRVKPLLDPSLDFSFDEYMDIIRHPFALVERDNALQLLHRLVTAARRRFGSHGRDREREPRPISALGDRILTSVASYTSGVTTFFLRKGAPVSDSRIASDLSYEMTILRADTQMRVGQAMELALRVKNVGQSTWLHHNVRDIGVVRLGAHLFSADRRLLVNDLARGDLGQEVAPGQSVTASCWVTCDAPGEYILGIDLVSEFVTWFEALGNKPRYLKIRVS